MPTFNALGEWCAGVGGVGSTWGTLSGTGTAIPGGTLADWVNNDVVAVQDCTSGCVLKTYNVRTSVGTVVAPRGGNVVSAGGGVWAAWLGTDGVFSSTGLALPASYLTSGSVGPDGAIAIKRFYASYGPWDVRETSGEVWLLTTGDAQQVQLLGSHRAVWTEGGNPRTAGACPTPNPVTRPFTWLKMLAPSPPTDPDWWCLYQDATGRLLLHPVGSASGYVVAGAGSNTFRPDLVRLSPTSVKVVWATNEGEAASSIVVATVNLAAARTALGSGLVVPAITPYASPALLGYFPYATSGGAAPGSFVGENCRIDFTPHSGVFDMGGTKILSYVDTEYDLAHGMTIEASITAQPAPRFVYWGDRFTRTAPPAGFWSSLDPRDVPACPVYRDPGETDAALASAGLSQLAAAASHGFKAVLVAGVWNRNNTLANQVVLDGGPVARGWLDDAHAAGLFFFGINRGATAVPPQFVPEFQTLVDEFHVAGLPTELGGGSELGPPGGGSGLGPPAPDPGPAVTPRFNPAVVVPSGRQYPHVDGITDWRSQQTSRLLWDRVYDAHDKIEESTSQIDALRELLLAHDKRVDALQVAAGEALAEAQRARGAGEGGGGTDFGAGQAGCSSAGSTGHVTTGTLTVGLAGQIICGTGAEFPALLVATATRAAQEANRSELLDRMIWHLGQAGFAASRYHTDQAQYYHLLFDAIAVDGTPVLRQYAYRVLSYMPEPTAPWDPALVVTTTMSFGGQTLGQTTAAEPGIPD